MTDDRIKAVFESYGQFATGKECALVHAIAEAVAPQRTWVGLDQEEIRKTNHHMVEGAYHYSFKQGAEWAEAKLKEKNNG